MLTEVYMETTGVRHTTDEQWNAWRDYLSDQQEHECPPDCTGRGCNIPQQMLKCPPLSEWRHGL
jgi:hypothetical protein